MAMQQRGKINKAPAEEVVEYLIKPGIAADLARSYQSILNVNRAHVVMLAECGIITPETAGKILAVTADLMGMRDTPVFEITTDVEDLYFNFERYLIARTGLKTGGQQHTARSRNDLLASVTRMDVRLYYLRICALFIEMRQTLLELAKGNTDAVMSGYTHLQPSEPITFAHYAAGVLGALERDYDRLESAYVRLNLCPLGACSMASTSFPIDRERTAALLGFDGIINNSIDCVASRDYVMEIMSALAIAANTLSRLSADLYNWAAPEFNYLEVDDSVAVCSSIMPQKKNPITLEHVKAKAGHMGAFFISAFSALKNVPFTHCRDVSTESVKHIWSCMQEMEASLRLINVTVMTLQINKKRMLEAAMNNFCTVTELANYLVRYDGMAFRAAHELVADLVNYLNEQDKKPHETSRGDLDILCTRLAGRKTALTDEQIARALDPALNAHAKQAKGGTAPKEVERQLTLIEQSLLAHKDALDTRKERLCQAAQALDSAASTYSA